MGRRRLLCTAGAASLALLAVPRARAQGTAPSAATGRYPDRPIRVVVPFPAGGATDIWSRLVAGPMGEALGQPLVIENRGGAGGMIGAEAVARAPADGHTLLFTITSLVQSPVVFRRAPYDAERDFAPIGGMGGTPLVFAVSAGNPARTLAGFVEQSRNRSVPYGSYSPGSTGHVFAQLFSDLAGLGMNHVAYRGEAPMQVDLVSGRVQCGLVSMTGSKEFLRSGQIRGLAVMGRNRLASLPDVPTFIELGYPDDFDWSGFIGLLGPARMPAPVTERLANAFRDAMHRPDVLARLAEMDVLARWTGPEDMRRDIVSARDRWTVLVERTGIALE